MILRLDLGQVLTLNARRNIKCPTYTTDNRIMTGYLFGVEELRLLEEKLNSLSMVFSCEASCVNDRVYIQLFPS
jgi:hypothetical protein